MLQPWIGKIIGAIFGYWLAGTFGLMLGLLIGHYFDMGLAKSIRQLQTQNVAVQNSFFCTTFSVMGHLAKADGRVSENDIRMARNIMARMGLNEAQRHKAIYWFTQGKQNEFNLQNTLQDFMKNAHRYRPLLELFIDLQLQAALADGSLTENKKRILQQITQQLGFPPLNLFVFEHNGYYQHNQRQSSPAYTTLTEAYATLAIPSTATDSQVKQAYRRLMSQNHPDKLIAKGLPEAMLKVATEKTQKIKSAYEQICAARGI